MSEETLEAFKNEAKAVGKTISDIVVEAIFACSESKQSKTQSELETPGVSPPASTETEETATEPTLNDIMFRVASLESYLVGSVSALGDLSLRIARTAAAAHYYGVMNAKFALV